MKSRVLVGAQEFMQALSERAQEAKHSLYVQAMTFEGDAAGEELIDLMIASPAKDKRLIVDSFSKVVVSDHFVFGPRYFLDKYFRNEIKNTKALIKKAREAGIQVKFTNPVGPLMVKYPLRNHKKMMIVDEEVCYLGGINFSDHNFEWHDMMVELSDKGISGCLTEDFRKTWEGENQSGSHDFDDAQVFLLNGIKSENIYQKLWDKLRNAKKSVEVISPYVSEPLLGVLKEVPARGVTISIISPEENNKSIFKDLIQSEARKGYFQLFHYQGMSHLKAILIDGEELVFGSSNYDLVSYYFEQEVVVTTRKSELINQFKERVLESMLAESRTPDVLNNPGRIAHLLTKGLRIFCSVASNSLLRPH